MLGHAVHLIIFPSDLGFVKYNCLLGPKDLVLKCHCVTLSTLNYRHLSLDSVRELSM